MSVDELTPQALFEACERLWRLPHPGPKNLFSSGEFRNLCGVCEKLYPGSGSGDSLAFALHSALMSLGLPCAMPPKMDHLILPVNRVAASIDGAFRATGASVVHLCPLDCADSLPTLKFGPASVSKFTPEELARLVCVDRLHLRFPSWRFDAERYAAFAWLVVREPRPHTGSPGQRNVPLLFTPFDPDSGRIEPHAHRFPAAVEAALLALLLAPWEEWANYVDIDWRGFRIPWVHTMSDDLFVDCRVPPSPDTLNWEPCVYTDLNGEEVETERPVALPLKDDAANADRWVNDSAWNELESARKCALFGGPVGHFLVRAFHSNDIDEFLAHITVIEAALGEKTDHDARNRPKIGKENPGATHRVATRLSGLLGDKQYAMSFKHLFEARSEFLHGRAMTPIPGNDRVLARRLARLTVDALIKAAPTASMKTRSEFLRDMLDKGLVL